MSGSEQPCLVAQGFGIKSGTDLGSNPALPIPGCVLMGQALLLTHLGFLNSARGSHEAHMEGCPLVTGFYPNPWIE